MLLIGSENRRPRAENPRTSKDISLSPCVRSPVSVKIFSLHFWVCLCYCWPVLLAKCSLRPWPGGLVDIFHRLLLWPQFMMRIGRSALHLPVHILRLTFMVGSVASPGAYWILGFGSVGTFAYGQVSNEYHKRCGMCGCHASRQTNELRSRIPYSIKHPLPREPEERVFLFQYLNKCSIRHRHLFSISAFVLCIVFGTYCTCTYIAKINILPKNRDSAHMELKSPS